MAPETPDQGQAPARPLLRARGKLAFLNSLAQHSRVLDVGCGNNSPWDSKTLRPDLFYTGIDVGDYNQAAGLELADEYILTQPGRFAAKSSRFRGRLDAVVSSHNLEHCDDPETVLSGMLAAVAPGGRIYLAFPCEESASFPKRRAFR